MLTQIHPVQLQYSHTIGRAEFSGPGFRAPVGIARDAGDRLYVLNRSYEGRPDGKRITICTVGEEYITEFGRGVSAERAQEDAPDNDAGRKDTTRPAAFRVKEAERERR